MWLIRWLDMLVNKEFEHYVCLKTGYSNIYLPNVDVLLGKSHINITHKMWYVHFETNLRSR